jgi:hypothetical protein
VKPHQNTSATLFLTALCLLLSAPRAETMDMSGVPETIVSHLDIGTPQDMIVLYDDRDIELESEGMRRKGELKQDDDAIRTFKSARYRELKKSAEAGFAPEEAEEAADYAHLPMKLLRFHSRAALEKFLQQPAVKAVYENGPVYPHLTYSLPFIGQPAVAAGGMTGNGGTVAVIDTGINYTLPAFGSCSAPGLPASCKVAASVDVTGHNLTLNTDARGHGTNVAGIAAGVAPGAHIAAINAFSAGASTTGWIIAGINWAIANKGAYNITTLNMSLGDNVNYTSPCDTLANPFLTPVNNLRAAGILPVASSGNSAFTDGMSAPACTPGVVSVGAVYDANWGGPYTWSSGCTDSSSGADRIPCFSNSASFLTLLAPGAFVTGAGIQMAGTSQAAPHVAGAAAVLRSTFPTESLDQTTARMTSSGALLTDPRNGLIFPRLKLGAAVGTPANDQFAGHIVLSGDTGQLGANNVNGTKEAGEPNHAGVVGGKSIWWSWTAATDGVAAFTTHGSSFDTLLAVYTGTAVTGLTEIAANNNDGSTGLTSGVLFTARAGTTYRVAVDGSYGASGQIKLNWSLNQQADLAIGISAPGTEFITGEPTYQDITVTNNGPSPADGVAITGTLSTGSIIDSLPPDCLETTGVINCSLGTLPSGVSVTSRIQLHYAAAGNHVSTARVSTTTLDPAPANNSATLSVFTGNPAAEPVPGLPLPLAGGAALILAFLSARRSSHTIVQE